MIVTCPECATRYDVADKAFSSGGRAVRCNHCACEWYQIGPSGGRSEASEDTGGLAFDQADAPRGARGRTTTRGRFDARDEERRLPLERDDRLGDEPMMAAAETALRARRDERPARRGRRDPLPPAVVPGRGARNGRGKRRSWIGALLFPLGGLALAGVAAAALYLGPKIDTGSLSEVPLTPTEGIETASAVATPAPSRTVGEGLVFVEFKYDLVELPAGPALEVWGRVANNSPDETLSPTIEIISKDKDGKALQRWLARPEARSIAPGESARFSSRMMYPLKPVHDVELVFAAR